MRIGLACVILVALSTTASAEDPLPLAQPDGAKQPFHEAERRDLSGLLGFSTGDIAGKKLKDIVTHETTIRVIVLANNTSAPNSLHMVHVARLLESNPTIEAIWTKDKTSGARKWDTSYDNLTPFFAVLLESKNGHFTGLLFLARGKEKMVKVVSEAGVGIVKLVADEKKASTGSKAANSATADQP
jgi:hypothetical protein